jgi:hypothetical protein
MEMLSHQIKRLLVFDEPSRHSTTLQDICTAYENMTKRCGREFLATEWSGIAMDF